MKPYKSERGKVVLIPKSQHPFIITGQNDHLFTLIINGKNEKVYIGKIMYNPEIRKDNIFFITNDFKLSEAILESILKRPIQVNVLDLNEKDVYNLIPGRKWTSSEVIDHKARNLNMDKRKMEIFLEIIFNFARNNLINPKRKKI